MHTYTFIERILYVYGCLVTKLCPTFATPWAIARQGGSVHGILQARILEWVAISFSYIYIYIWAQRGFYIPTENSGMSKYKCVYV